MDWDTVLDPSLSPEEVILERLVELHQARREDFASFVSTELIVSLEFADIGERFTLALGPDQARAVRGDMIDFPQASLRGQAAEWKRSIALLGRLVHPADERIDHYQGRVEIDRGIRDDFERFDGVLEVEIVDLPDGGDPITFEVILNDYDEPPRARRARISIQWSVLEDLANGRVTPVEAARRATLRGAVGLALELGGFCMAEFDL